MTETEACVLLKSHLEKHLMPDHEIYIGKVYHASKLGFSFEAGTYSISEGKPASFPIWAIDAKTKSVGLDLIQNRQP